MSKIAQRWKHALQTDANWNRLGRFFSRSARALPRATAEYILEKFPIIGWLPRYDYRWIPNDIIAGLTLGLMLVPQSLAYADIATIPVQYGLMSAWFPATLYAFMGTSKGEMSEIRYLLPLRLTYTRSLYWAHVTYRSADG